MDSILTFIGRFFIYSVVMSVFSETVAGLLTSVNKAFFFTKEEEAIKEVESAFLQKEFEEEADEMDAVMPGYLKKIDAYFKWAQEHEVMNVFALYILCFIPIVNIVVFFNNLHRVVKLFIIKFKIISHRFKQL